MLVFSGNMHSIALYMQKYAHTVHSSAPASTLLKRSEPMQCL